MRFLFVFLLFLPVMAFAQAKESLMYSSGRIYVVVAVMLIILLGLILYLIRIERKVKKLEDAETKA
ncbi:CcmD family protein [Niabella aquatica]